MRSFATASKQLLAGQLQSARVHTHKTLPARGFALLIAVIFMSVMLAIGLSLGTIAFKQEQLTSTALRAQDAFYAADAALECALYADQKQDVFNYDTYNKTGNTPSVSCEGTTPTPFPNPSGGLNGTDLVFKGRMPVDGGAECADIIVYKPDPTTAKPITYIFSQGYDVSCSRVTSATPGSASFASQGLEAFY